LLARNGAGLDPCGSKDEAGKTVNDFGKFVGRSLNAASKKIRKPGGYVMAGRADSCALCLRTTRRFIG
jgi:hypothetical protein